MHNLRMLSVTSDNSLLEQFRQKIQEQVGSAQPLVSASSIDEACSLLRAVNPRLIIVHWNRENAQYEQLDRLLWLTTVQVRTAPVVVIADRYCVDQATTLFRMGVSEYLSRAQHLDQLGSVLASYFPAWESRLIQSEPHGSVVPPANAWTLSKLPFPASVQAV